MHHPNPSPVTPSPRIPSILLIVRVLGARVRFRSERGQATAEYVLVLLGAAAVATLLLAWATSTGRVGDLLDAVVDSIAEKVS
jgi:hypothetical protein